MIVSRTQARMPFNGQVNLGQLVAHGFSVFTHPCPEFLTGQAKTLHTCWVLWSVHAHLH